MQGASKKLVDFTAKEIWSAISDLREELMAKAEASELFAKEREQGAMESLVASLFQSFGGSELYPSIESKAAHLLYFTVKNHPFVDGNKRCGAFSFVWFLKKAGLLDATRLTPDALTALTLLVAESNPKDKDQMVGLILLLLAVHE
jgi:prophage maintenance system killer protein